MPGVGEDLVWEVLAQLATEVPFALAKTFLAGRSAGDQVDPRGTVDERQRQQRAPGAVQEADVGHDRRQVIR